MTFFEDAARFEEGSRELAAAGAALVLAGLALTPLCVTLARRFSPKSGVFFARWRFLHAALVALLLLGLTAVAVPLLGRFLPADTSEFMVALLATVLGFGLTSCFILWLAARLDPAGIQSLGFRVEGSLRSAAVSVGCYILLMPGLIGISFLWPWLLERLGSEFEPQQIAVGLEQLAGTERLLGAAIAILAIPFLEELIFRGFLQPLLVQNLGDRGGVFLASLIFALLHGESAFLPIFCLSLLLGSLMLRTQRLSAPFAVHALNNAIVFSVLGNPHFG